MSAFANYVNSEISFEMTVACQIICQMHRCRANGIFFSFVTDAERTKI
jgi:hypothetical protein